MADGVWPPDWYQVVLDALGPWGSGLFDGLIPLMDVRQHIYEYAKAVVQWIPHQPPVYSRPVNGLVAAAFSGGAKMPIELGTVGYNADTHQVTLSVNKLGGVREANMTMDVQSVVPTIFQLFCMLPWDFIGELESGIYQNAIGADQPPRAQDVVAWAFSKVRDGLAEIGVAVPETPGDYDIPGADFSSITIPQGDYTAHNGDTEYTFNLATARTIAATGSEVRDSGVINGVISTENKEDVNAVVSNMVTVDLPDTILNQDNLSFKISQVLPGYAPREATYATMQVSIRNTKTAWTYGNMLLNIQNFGTFPAVIEPGTLIFNDGNVVFKHELTRQLVILYGASADLFFTAETIGELANFPTVGFTQLSYLNVNTPELQDCIYYISDSLNGITGGADLVIPTGTVSLAFGTTVYTSTPLTTPLSVVAGEASQPLTFTATTPEQAADFFQNTTLTPVTVLPDLGADVQFRAGIGVQGKIADPGIPTTLQLVVTNSTNAWGSIVPSARDLILYNIPIMNATQKIYDLSMELVEAISHHPPAFQRDVITGGVIPTWIFRVIDRGNVIYQSNVPPTAADVSGKQFTASVTYKDRDGPVGNEVLLLEHNFGIEETFIDFEAGSPGPDPFFEGYRNIPLDPVAAQEAADAINALLGPVMTARTAAEGVLDAALQALAILPYDDPGVAAAQQAVEDARTSLNDLITSITGIEDRRDSLQALAEATGLPGDVILSDVVLPSTLNLPNVRGEIVALEQGMASETLDNGTVLPATTTKFRMRIVIQDSGDQTLGTINLPSTFSGYTPKDPIYARTEAVAESAGKITASTKTGMLDVNLDDSILGAKIGLQVQGVVSSGSNPGLDALNPGADQGSRGIVAVAFYGKDEGTVDYADFSPNTEWSFTAAGKTFLIDPSYMYQTAASRAPSTFSYTGTPVDTQFTDQPLDDFEVTVSTPLINTQMWARWQNPAEVTYIGEEFNLANPWGGPAVSGIARFVEARLRYKLRGQTTLWGTPRVNLQWDVVYTPAPARAPHGNLAITNIRYDASTRIVTLTNSRNQTSIDIHLRSVVWFMIQLIMLIPLEVI